MFDVLRSCMYYRHTKYFALERREGDWRCGTFVFLLVTHAHIWSRIFTISSRLVGGNKLENYWFWVFFSPPQKNQQCRVVLWMFALRIVRLRWGLVTSVSRMMWGCLWELVVTWFTLFLGRFCDSVLTPCWESGGSPMFRDSLFGPRRLIGFTPHQDGMMFKPEYTWVHCHRCWQHVQLVTVPFYLILQNCLQGQTLLVCLKTNCSTQLRIDGQQSRFLGRLPFSSQPPVLRGSLRGSY